MTFVLATANPDKAREITEIVAGRIALAPRPPDVPDVEETGETLLDNARLKAAALVAATGAPAIADDTGLEVDALGGGPGVYSARYAGEGATYADNVTKLLHELRGRRGKERAARFVTVAIACFPDGREVVAQGAVTGHIAEAAAGISGFGYDPVFIPEEGDGRTFAQMVDNDPAAKHRLSHRGRAFDALVAQLS